MSMMENVKTNWVEIHNFIKKGYSYEEIVEIMKARNIMISKNSISKYKKELEKIFEEESKKEKKLKEYEKEKNSEILKKIRRLEEKMEQFEHKTSKKISDLELEMNPSVFADEREGNFIIPYRNMNPKENFTFRLPSEVKEMLKELCGDGAKNKGLLDLSRNEFITGLIVDFYKNFKKNNNEK
ncbi:hypothetical protein OF820_07095 [Oceanotoga sp. DSM 15011]|uniref:Uncharacterized protein n=1 Tax=Oceanotoga teriensis TaxID=515440 RepID=A0AA45C5K2_9BACT|nr:MULTISPECIES: hypothetical protein [Oceanotoga]MDN5341725.1 hypothetical protein [Oceanotoga sp.]MDO7976369.1 hypothetical protein [Oceanotoga teriensis]PWJ89304.1 hypothetical protein C7380_11530 [Oceanotoga teriensis]UYO98839.1 hypothetical protein OF820_07095 [Oceanotoga sp. DSM 15011]